MGEKLAKMQNFSTISPKLCQLGKKRALLRCFNISNGFKSKMYLFIIPKKILLLLHTFEIDNIQYYDPILEGD